ncbi:MAG TPA: hypothetical protein VEA16_06480, partial [Vicinamibacterales bacterium]|nr:hypothetical protein [Vicinamibacterales bacterium]
MRKTKASKQRPPMNASVAKRTTSRRVTAPRSRTSGNARRIRRVSAKSIPPASVNERPKLLEQAVAATAALSSKRYPLRNLLVLFLGFAATTAAGGWAVYVALFGAPRHDIGAATLPVIVGGVPAKAPSIEVVAPKAEDRVAAAPGDEASSSISEEASRSVSVGPSSMPVAP